MPAHRSSTPWFVLRQGDDHHDHAPQPPGHWRGWCRRRRGGDWAHRTTRRRCERQGRPRPAPPPRSPPRQEGAPPRASPAASEELAPLLPRDSRAGADQSRSAPALSSSCRFRSPWRDALRVGSPHVVPPLPPCDAQRKGRCHVTSNWPRCRPAAPRASARFWRGRHSSGGIAPASCALYGSSPPHRHLGTAVSGKGRCGLQWPGTTRWYGSAAGSPTRQLRTRTRRVSWNSAPFGSPTGRKYHGRTSPRSSEWRSARRTSLPARTRNNRCQSLLLGKTVQLRLDVVEDPRFEQFILRSGSGRRRRSRSHPVSGGAGDGMRHRAPVPTLVGLQDRQHGHTLCMLECLR